MERMLLLVLVLNAAGCAALQNISSTKKLTQLHQSTDQVVTSGACCTGLRRSNPTVADDATMEDEREGLVPTDRRRTLAITERPTDFIMPIDNCRTSNFDEEDLHVRGEPHNDNDTLFYKKPDFGSRSTFEHTEEEMKKPGLKRQRTTLFGKFWGKSAIAPKPKESTGMRQSMYVPTVSRSMDTMPQRSSPWVWRATRVREARMMIDNVRRMHFERLTETNPCLSGHDLHAVKSSDLDVGMQVELIHAVKSGRMRKKTLMKSGTLVTIVGRKGKTFTVAPVAGGLSVEVPAQNVRTFSKVAHDQRTEMAKVWEIFREAKQWQATCEHEMEMDVDPDRMTPEVIKQMKARESFLKHLLETPEFHVFDMQDVYLPQIRTSRWHEKASLYGQLTRLGDAAEKVFIDSCIVSFGIPVSGRESMSEKIQLLVDYTDGTQFDWSCKQCQLLFGNNVQRCPSNMKKRDGNTCLSCAEELKAPKKKWFQSKL